MLTIVTFATPNYDEVYNRYVLASIKALELDKHHTHYRIDRILKKGWVSRTNLKPGVILQELEEGNSVLYVDADAVITSKEVMDIDALIPPEYIAACYFLDWDKWGGGWTGTVEPLTGTLFFRHTAKALVEQWHELANESAEPDGKSWAKVIEGRKDIFHLPIEYCYINTLPNGNKGNIPCKNPLIVHHQESRNARS